MSDARKIAEERLARGEITAEQFREIVENLGPAQPQTSPNMDAARTPIQENTVSRVLAFAVSAFLVFGAIMSINRGGGGLISDDAILKSNFANLVGGAAAFYLGLKPRPEIKQQVMWIGGIFVASFVMSMIISVLLM